MVSSEHWKINTRTSETSAVFISGFSQKFDFFLRSSIDHAFLFCHVTDDGGWLSGK